MRKEELMGMERKYGRVTTERGNIPAEEPVVVFRAQDKLTPTLMRMYGQLCASHGLTRMAEEAEKTAQGLESWKGEKKLPDW
jgi:hypothetical protein